MSDKRVKSNSDDYKTSKKSRNHDDVRDLII